MKGESNLYHREPSQAWATAHTQHHCLPKTGWGHWCHSGQEFGEGGRKVSEMIVGKNNLGKGEEKKPLEVRRSFKWLKNARYIRGQILESWRIGALA